ncbi:MAG: hypothetical protein QOJ09_2859 [Actinomycetota bacterium]|jgi:plastocyanin|nr:hypothetical protein [Actinomycetota bacterium]
MAKLRIASVSLLLAFVFAACGGSSNNSGTASNTTTALPSTAGATVVLKDLKFNPDKVSIKTGATVSWQWKESVLHNVTAKDGSFKSDNRSDGTFGHTFDKAGTFSYECTLHSGMSGEVTVS